MLGDHAWVERYLHEMPARLADAHDALTTGLTGAGIPHVPGEAGFFLIADMRRFLREPTFEAERTLWQRMVDQGVNLTPGKAIRSPEPGLFRICFTATPTESLPTAVKRITAAVAAG